MPVKNGKAKNGSMTKQKNPKVSVVIPSWNRRRDLQKCLNSLARLRFPSKEVIVVDNGSTDGTQKMLADSYPAVRVIANERNLGAAQARNQAIAASLGELIWFLDSDTEIVGSQTLAAMIKILQTYPAVAAVGGELLVKNSVKKIKVHQPLLFGRGVVTFLKPSEGQMISCRFLSTANFLIRKKLLVAVGGFDPHYFYLGEDADLCLKLNKLGYTNLIDRSTVVIHHVSRHQRRSNLFLQEKNRIRRVLLHVNILAIPLFPLLDFGALLLSLLRQYQQLKGRALSDLASVNVKFGRPAGRRVNSILKKLLLIAPIYAGSVIYGYLWNGLFLPQTFYLRFSKPNYLK